MRRKLRKYRFLVVVAVAALAASSAYAYTSTIGGVSAPGLGSGSGSIDKYELVGVNYNLNAAVPRNIDSVSFTLNGASTSTVVRVRLVNTGSWYDCDESGAPTITCATAGVTAVAANGNDLTVVASG